MSAEPRDITPAKILAGHQRKAHGWVNGMYVAQCWCGATIDIHNTRKTVTELHAEHQLVALIEAGYAVVKLPVVAFKGPYDTDAKFFRQAADRLEDERSGYVGGSNLRAAVSELLRTVAREADK